MPGKNYAGWSREAIISTPTWPSAAPALVTELLPLATLDPGQGVNKQFYFDQHGVVGYSKADVLRVAPRLTGLLSLRYGGLEPIYAAAMGIEAKRLGATVMPEQLAAGVYRHVFEVDHVLSAMAPWVVPADGVLLADLTGANQRKVRRGTIAAYREFGAWEWLSVMIDQLSFTWNSQQGYGTCGLECVAYTTNTSPTINTPTTLTKAKPNAYPDVLFRQGVIRIGAYSAVTPLDSSNQVACESVNITLQNQLESAPGPRTGLYMEEYERGGPPLVLGSLLKPRYTSNALVSAWEANTRYMMDVKFTGRQIPGTAYQYQLNLYVPGLFFTQVEPSPLSRAVSSQPMQWFAASPDIAPAGMPVTARLGPFIIETIGTRAAHTLL